jgi:uracil-DNA glycosylase
VSAAFDRLLREIRACRICAGELPHEPRPVIRAKETARIVIAGQAPGTRVHASGMPFTDPSGDRLREWMGVTKDTFYDDTKIAIVPMGFCFPGLDAKGGDLPPRKECAPAWRDKVFAKLKNVELTLLVGQYSQAWHLKTQKTLTETVAAWRDYGPQTIPLPHPSWRNNAWIKKNPWFEAELLPHLRRRISRILRA